MFFFKYRRVSGFLIGAMALFVVAGGFAAQGALSVCSRYPVGSNFTDPGLLFSDDGNLRVNFTYATSTDESGNALYCYFTPSGIQAPVLRVNPGDRLSIAFTNDLPPDESSSGMAIGTGLSACGASVEYKTSTNLHYHGTFISPSCHQDAVVYTLINPNDTFGYELLFPQNHPPGLYAYHPHVHGVAELSVLGGASSAIVVEGIQNFQPAVAGLSEKILIIRDSQVKNSRIGAPSKDISLNYIPIRYPDYTPAVLQIRPKERQFWRVLNGAADTIINLELRYDGTPQPLYVVAIDGVPLDNQTLLTQYQISLGPMARAEFIIDGPSLYVADASLVTLKSNNGIVGAIEPERPLLKLLANANAEDACYVIPPVSKNATRSLTKVIDLLAQKPARTRKLYFTEFFSWPFDPKKPNAFYIVVDGQDPAAFDPNNPPSIVAKLGDVEDWIIENRSPETHVFHIHQLHFVQLETNGKAVQPQAQTLMDEIIVAPWDNFGPYPSVKLRMDFRDPETLGIFPYHCHILNHEDLGMMATIEVGTSPVSSGKSLFPSVSNVLLTGAFGLFFNLYQRLFR